MLLVGMASLMLHTITGTQLRIRLPYPQQQQAGQPIVVSSPAPKRSGGTLARMGLGGILGGVAGRYAVGGRKSNKTILGTSIGAAAGALLGRATC